MVDEKIGELPPRCKRNGNDLIPEYRLWQLVGQGISDRLIAARYGVEWQRVGRLRRKIGIPARVIRR